MYRRIQKYCVVLLFLLIIFPTSLFAWTPPAGSPLADGLHPRLWFIPQSYRDSNPNAPGITVTEMQTKLSTYYSTEFQALIDSVNTYWNDTISTKDISNLHSDGINCAFMYMVDPANFGSWNNTKTKAEYGQNAKDHWDQLATNIKNETKPSSDTSSWVDTRYVYSYNSRGLVLACIYDWLEGGGYFDGDDVDLLLDTMDNSHTLETQLAAKTPYLNNVATGCMHNAYYIALALYGDTADADLISRFNEIENIHIKGLKDLGNHIFSANEGNWHEGLGIYYFESVAHIALFYGGLSSAMNEDLFESTGFLSQFPEIVFYNVVPTAIDGGYNWTHYDDDDPDDIQLSSAHQKPLVLIGGMLNNSDPDGAGLVKWYRENSGWTTGTGYPNTRKDYAIIYFFGGLNHVTSKAPSELNLPLSQSLGEEFVFKSDLTNEDSTHIVFWAQKYHSLWGGHNHLDFASFLIHKCGNLAINRSINKAFSGGNILATRYSMFYNTIGVYKSGETFKVYNLMSYRDSGYDASATLPTDSAYGVSGANRVGEIVGKELEGTHYDYVDYDYSLAWDNTKVDYAEREFVYFRSEGGTNDEYVVVFDRINSVNSSYTKYWLLQASNEPTLIANDGSTITMTAYTSNGWSDGGKWVHTSASPTQDNTIRIDSTYDITHGRLFNKTLLPNNFQINKVGGPNHYWEDSKGTLIHTKTLTEEEKYYRGQYTMQIQSTTNQQYDNFLNVIQFGDSNTLANMTAIEKISATDSGSNVRMHGALIKDNSKNRVVLFSADQSGAAVTTDVNYTIDTSTASIHLLFKLQPNTMYSVDISGIGTSQVQSSGIGTLMFVNSSGSPHDYSISVLGTAGVYPAPPTDIELTKTATDATLTWTKSTDDGAGDNDVTGYKIYRSSDGTTYSLIGTVAAGVTTYTDSNPGGVQYYKVAAVDSGGLESSLDYQSGPMASFARPSAPTGLKVKEIQ